MEWYLLRFIYNRWGRLFSLCCSLLLHQIGESSQSTLLQIRESSQRTLLQIRESSQKTLLQIRESSQNA